MKISIGTKHNAVCLLQDFKHGDGDPLKLAAEKWPNAFRAVDEFRKKMSHEIQGPESVDVLGVTVFLDHCGGMYEDNFQRLAKTSRGYSVGIVMTKEVLMAGDKERAFEDILSVFDDKLAEILERPALSIA